MATAFKPVDVVEVRIWGKRVGAVLLDTATNYYAFEYDPKWVKTGIELAPLRMPLSAAREPFLFTDLPEATYQRLPAILADALPDRFGNALIDAWMAERGVASDRVTALDRLAYMGKRGMGALEFKPARGSHASSSTALQLGSLVDAARQAVDGSIGTESLAKSTLNQIIQVGTSAGGARAKATVAWNPTTNEVRAGQFDVPDGFEHWLLKFDGLKTDRSLGGGAGYGRLEYAYYLMARAAGLNMAPCRLLEENGRAHFMTKRFDREGNTRLHMQSLCALDHLDYKKTGVHSYAQLFNVMQRLGLESDAMRQMLRRMIFNVMAVNWDDHTKNQAFLLRENEKWEISPAYDISFACDPTNPWINQHQMAINSKFKQITHSDIKALADQVGIGLEVTTALREVSDALSRWSEFAQEAGVPEASYRIIGEKIQEICEPVHVKIPRKGHPQSIVEINTGHQLTSP